MVVLRTHAPLSNATTFVVGPRRSRGPAQRRSQTTPFSRNTSTPVLAYVTRQSRQVHGRVHGRTTEPAINKGRNKAPTSPALWCGGVCSCAQCMAQYLQSSQGGGRTCENTSALAAGSRSCMRWTSSINASILVDWRSRKAQTCAHNIRQGRSGRYCWSRCSPSENLFEYTPSALFALCLVGYTREWSSTRLKITKKSSI